MRKQLVVLLVMLQAVLSVTDISADAKSKTLKLSRKSVRLQTGEKIKISIKNGVPKKVRWSVNKGKKQISLSAKTKKSVRITAKKAGTATVTAKVTYKKKIKKLKLKVKVTAKEQGKTPSNVKMKKQTAFPAQVTACLDASGYVKVQWGKVSEAHAYVIQRRTGNESWEEIKVTASKSYTDRTVREDTTYEYRVRANCNNMCTKYSTSVTIRTGKIKSIFIIPDNPATETPEPTSTPTETPEPTPYQPKYSYEVEVLNKFTIYENVPIVLYVKTDNPNPNDFDGVYVSFSGGSGSCGRCYSYEDIKYLNPEEDKQSTSFREVQGGFITTIEFQDSGNKTVKIQELDKSVEAIYGDYDATGKSVWQTVDMFQIEVQDGERALQKRCNEIIKEVSNDNYESEYPSDTTVGKKWDELQGEEKLERLECYVREHLYYPRVGALTSLGYMPVWVVQENVGAYWETGFADCGASNDMMCVLARTLGYEAELRNTTLNGGLHIQAVVTIDGVEHIFDATPWQGGYKDWDYIL